MQKKKLAIGTLAFTVAVMGMIVSRKFPVMIHADEAVEAQKIREMVTPSIVYAEVLLDTELYANEARGGKLGEVKKGSRVEILEERSEKTYHIKDAGSGMEGWMAGEALAIPADQKANRNRLTRGQIALYAKEMAFESSTPYYVWVDLDRQRIYVLCREEGADWDVARILTCATGKNRTPTIRGLFQIGERGEWFFSDRLGSGAKYWVRFCGTYLFHSVAMDENQRVTDGVLGEKRSSGCVRMAVADAKWFFDTIPEGTAVFVN